MRYAFAHRGGRAHGPDNTIPTFAKALADGATALETDAWVTADGIVVLDHDGIHHADRPIGEVTRAELADHIPTLAELYDACGTDFDLAIDVKGADAAAIGEVARAYGAADRLWLFAQNAPSRDDTGDAHVGVTVTGKQIRCRRTRRATLDRLAASRVEAVNARWPLWRKSAVDDVHAAGLLAFAWDVQWPVALRRCRRIGIDGIFSDHIKLLREATQR